MTIQNKKIFASILFVLISFVCIAQPMPPHPSAPNDGGPPPPGFPIDGAIPVLMLAGLFYGIRNKLK